MTDDGLSRATATVLAPLHNRFLADAPSTVNAASSVVVADEPAATLAFPAHVWLCFRCRLLQAPHTPALYMPRAQDEEGEAGICVHCAEVVMALAVTQ